MIKDVDIAPAAQKQASKAPVQVQNSLAVWVRRVKEVGLEEVRKIPGYHDEPLKGERKGQRSIRLNRSWRAFYVILKDGTAKCVSVFEVNKHEY